MNRIDGLVRTRIRAAGVLVLLLGLPLIAFATLPLPPLTTVSGSLLLDTDEITITHGAASGTSGSIICTDGDCQAPGAGPFSDTTTTSGNLTDGTLNAQLMVNDVTVTTSTNAITTNSDASVNLQGHTLNLDSATSITLGGTFNGGGNLKLNFTTSLEVTNLFSIWWGAPATQVTATGDDSSSSTIKATAGVWQLDGVNSGYLMAQHLDFSKVHNLSDDGPAVFIFHDGANFTGMVAGGGTGMLDYSARTTAVNVGLGGTATGTSGWSGMSIFSGSTSSSSDTISGNNQTYNLTGVNAGNSGAASWTSFEKINDGGTGTITTTGGQTYQLSGNNAGTIISLLPGGFIGISNLSDASGTVNFGTNGSASGNVAVKTLNYSGYGMPVTFNLANGVGATTGIGGTWSSITAVMGSSNSDTVTGSNQIYALDNTVADSGNSNGVSWISFENIIDANGTVNFGTGGYVSGNVNALNYDYSSYLQDLTFNVDSGVITPDGIGGVLSAAGYGVYANAAQTNTVTANGRIYALDNSVANSGYSNSFSWSGFQNINDATGSVYFGTGGSVTGNVTAKTLDYSGYGSAVAFDLSNGAGTTTGMGGTWSGVSTVAGSSHSDTISGSNKIYHLTGTNAGNSGAVAWASFENLDDSAAGTFVFANGASVSGNLDGGGNGTLDYTAVGAAMVNLSGVGSSGVGGTTAGMAMVETSGSLGISGTAGGPLMATTNNGAMIQSAALTVTGIATLDAGTGAITLNNAGNHFQSKLNLQGSSADVASSSAMQIGAVGVSGNLTLMAPSVTNAAGDSTTFGTGNTIGHVIGAYVQGGDLNLHGTAATSDQLVVSGTATLGGNLALAFSAAPSAGQSFTLLSASAVSGTFANVSVTGLPVGLGTSVVYNPTNVMLTVQGSAQTLSISAPTSVILGSGPATVTVTASSGLAVTLTSSTPTVCSVSSASSPFQVDLLGIGTCTLSAAQAGDPTHAAVSQAVTFAITVPAYAPVPTLSAWMLLLLAALIALGAFAQRRRI